MRKTINKYVALCMALLLSTLSLCAQSTSVAMLHHAANDSTSVYYGMDAFINAYYASADGDLITLSSGSFHTCDITKEINIRGAGMQHDSINLIAPTVFMGDFQAYSENKHPDFRLTMEGINVYGKMYIYADEGSENNRTLYDAQFVKCRFRNVMTNFYSNGPYSTYFRSVCFVQCKIYNIDLLGGATFYNCVVNDVDQIRYLSRDMPFTSFDFVNCCVLCLDSYESDYSSVENSSFRNCVLVGNVPLSETNVAYNSVSCYYGDATNTTMFSKLPAFTDNNNHTFNSIQSIFKTYDGNNLSDSETLELQDSIKTNYLGMDGTQVGIYGGVAPFTPEVSFPVVSSLKVSPKSDDSGKLKVEMQVGNSK